MDQLFLLADVVEWNPEQGVLSGKVHEATQVGGKRGYDKLDFFKMQKGLSPEMSKYISRILTATDKVPAEVLQALQL